MLLLDVQMFGPIFYCPNPFAFDEKRLSVFLRQLKSGVYFAAVRARCTQFCLARTTQVILHFLSGVTAFLPGRPMAFAIACLRLEIVVTHVIVISCHKAALFCFK